MKRRDFMKIATIAPVSALATVQAETAVENSKSVGAETAEQCFSDQVVLDHPVKDFAALQCQNCKHSLSILFHKDGRKTIGCMHCATSFLITHKDWNKVMEGLFRFQKVEKGRFDYVPKFFNPVLERMNFLEYMNWKKETEND